MADINAMKQFFKDADPAEAQRGYEWATAAMEVRGLVAVPGLRKRRSDAGKPRTEAGEADQQLTLREPGQ